MHIYQGHVVHFYNHLIEQFRKSLAEAGIDFSKYQSFDFYSKDGNYLFKYTPDKKGNIVSASRLDSQGDVQEALYTLKYNVNTQSFEDPSQFAKYLNRTQMGFTIVGNSVPDSLYQGAQAENIAPCFAMGRGGKEFPLDGIEQVQWQGAPPSGIVDPATSKGSIEHFFRWACEQCELGIRAAGIDKRKFHSFGFTPPTNNYLIRYIPKSTTKKSLALTEVNEDGTMGKILFELEYDGKKFSPESHYGDIKAQAMLEGKTTERFDHNAYYLFSSDVVLPFLAGSKGTIYYLNKYANQIQKHGSGGIDARFSDGRVNRLDYQFI